MSDKKKSSINLIDLEFDGIKNSLRTYLRNQDRFKGIDFESPNIDTLLDILAYNTNKHAFFTHMDLSESHLDSAQLPDSIMSKAKELNYLPRSKESARARIRVSFTANKNNQPYIIPKGSTFTSDVRNRTYTFSIPETFYVSSTNNNFSFETDIYEGIYVKDSYIYNSKIDNIRFLISNKDVDIRSINVVEYSDNSTNGRIYTYAHSLLDLNERSRKFFLQPAEDERYEILFGDGIVGRRPKDGSTIVIEYRITIGRRGNNARIFNINFDPTSPHSELTSTPIVETIITSIDGKEKQSLNSIKYYAPRHFQIQERAIVASDYENILKINFPEINAISVYGGEELDPPQFGKVFISLDLNDLENIPEIKKEEYTEFIRQRNSLHINPIFVSPEYLYFSVESEIKYNIDITSSSARQIKSLVEDAIKHYNERYLNKFNAQFRFSNFICDIDDADDSIISNDTRVYFYKKIVPELNTNYNTDINFNFSLNSDYPVEKSLKNAGEVSTVFSSIFNYRGQECILKDDGEGNLYIVKYSYQTRRQERQLKDTYIIKVGTINYRRGQLKLRRFNIRNFDGNELKIYVYPRDKDIRSGKNSILTLEMPEVKVSIKRITGNII